MFVERSVLVLAHALSLVQKSNGSNCGRLEALAFFFAATLTVFIVIGSWLILAWCSCRLARDWATLSIAFCLTTACNWPFFYSRCFLSESGGSYFELLPTAVGNISWRFMKSTLPGLGVVNLFALSFMTLGVCTPAGLTIYCSFSIVLKYLLSYCIIFQSFCDYSLDYF